MLELDSENNENARNVYGTSLVSRNSLNYLYNGHGDTTAVLNGNTVVTEYEYDAFGNGVNFADDDSNPFRYCGEYYDTETKLIYLKARYYNPALGRFTAEDTYWNLGNMIYGDNAVEEKDESAEEDSFFEKPVHNPEPDFAAVLQSGNLYLYCRNNPIKYVDPSGNVFHFSCEDYKDFVSHAIEIYGLKDGEEQQLRLITEDVKNTSGDITGKKL